MNSHQFHISLYDLLFLGTIFIGLTFAGLLSFTKSINRPAKRFLAVALIAMVLWMIQVSGIDIQAGNYHSTLNWFPSQLSLAFGPLIFFYILKLTRPERKFIWKDCLHFVPSLLQLALSTLTFGQNESAVLNPLCGVLSFVSVIVYLYCSHRLIEDFYQRLKFIDGDRYRNELRWLHRLLTLFGLLWLSWAPFIAVDYWGYHGRLGADAFYSLYLVLVVNMIWIGAFAFLRSEVELPAKVSPSSQPSASTALRQKAAWLKNAVKEKRYYQDPELSLNLLAERLGLHTHELSRIVNTVLKKSFNDFINEYRVAEVIRKMQDPAFDHFTLLGIAYESGFNSQTTFSRIFKQATGKSPLDYKNELKKDYPSYKMGSRALIAPLILHREIPPKWGHDKLNRNYMFRNYLKIASRNFWKHKVFTLINVVGLSIGLSAALVIYLLIHYDLTFDKFHKDGDRIYRVVTNFTVSGSSWGSPGVCGPLPFATKSQVTGLQGAAPIFILAQPDIIVPMGSKSSSRFKLQDNVVVTDSDYFKLIEYKWLAGSAKSALIAPNQVVLTSDQAKKYFPTLSYDQMLGRIVVYDTLKTTVSGVVQSINQNTDFAFHDFISFPTAFSNFLLKVQLRLHNWGGISPSYQLFVKLAPQVTTARIERQLNDIEKRNLEPRPGRTEVFALQSLADIHFNTYYGTFPGGRVADKTTLYELSGIALFLLLLGCINFINLTTAQSARRAKEIGIRKTMGSSRGQLVFQFLSETFMITLFSVILSVAVTPTVLRFFSAFIPQGIHAGLILQPNIILFLVVLVIIVSLASGFYPAMVLSGYKPVSAIKNQANEGSSKTRSATLRKSLTVAQFAIAQFFIMATLVVSKQIYYAIHKDMGFKKEAILIVNSPAKNKESVFVFNSPLKNKEAGLNRVFLNKLRAIPQIEMVSLGFDPPASDYSNSTEGSYKDGKKELKIENLTTKFGDENYIKIYHIKLLAGRNLEPGDTSKAFLVNNTLARQIGFNDPHDAVGKVILNFNGDRDMRIIGVVSDFNQESIHAAIAPTAILTSTAPNFNNTFHIALKLQTSDGNEWHAAIAGMQKAWKEVYPADDFDYHFFDESIARLYLSEQNTATLLNWATGLSVLISCLGLLGLAIFTGNLRTKEIGVRKVLGASVAQIVMLLSRELMLLIILAFVIVSPIAWWAMTNWMQSFADRSPISWWIFALTGGGILFVAMLTSGYQTMSAALTNPVNSLRSE